MSRGREPLPSRVDDLPALPDAYGRTLGDGLRHLGLDLTPAARRAIDDHVRLLLAWIPAINLTAIRDPQAIALDHVLDSLTAVGHLRAWGVDRFVDLGSGGGFPGLPLAAAVPAAALLVDSVGKKVAFLETAVAATGLGGAVAVRAVRAETLASDATERGTWPAVVARAVGPLADLIELAFPLLRGGGRLVAWKRGDLTVELQTAGRAMGALGGGSLDEVDVGIPGIADHRLVVATKRGPTPASYPRDPAARRRRPW